MFKNKWKRRYRDIANSLIKDDQAYPKNAIGDNCFRRDQRFLAEGMLMVLKYGSSLEPMLDHHGKEYPHA